MASRTRDVFFATALVLALGAFTESFQIAWGSGFFVGRLSVKWFLVLLGHLVLLGASLWALQRGLYHTKTMLAARKRLYSAVPQAARWVLATFFIILPWVFIYYSPWGGLFTGFFTRSLLFAFSTVAAALLLTERKSNLLSWRAVLLSLLFVGSGLVIGDAFVRVTDYPLALHWSEGNRMWDYSVLFGRERYAYPPEKDIFVWIDAGRQTLWGLIFLWPNVGIAGVRAWSALLTTMPYALLGWFAFRPLKEARQQWFLAGLWTLVFLNQGPIYAPLILSAILVTFSRRRKLWIAIPLIALAGTYAGTSRFTWSFAPAIWAVLLTLSDGVLLHGKIRSRDWLRASVLGLSGLWGRGLPILQGIISGLLSPSSGGVVSSGPGEQNVNNLESLQAVATTQPFTWHRMLPNDVFPPGIILGLLAAAGPLLILLVYLIRKKEWKTVPLQRVVIGGALLAFLAVGLVVSAKVGGGADLHNLDMLLVTFVLLAGVAWEAGLYKKLSEWVQSNRFVQAMLCAMLLIPALFPLYSGAPLSLPDDERIAYIMERIDANVSCAVQYGPVLFLDQRQLLTFRYQQTVPLNPEYEKKYVMDHALADNRIFFDGFVEDLEAHKYALIVGELEDTVFRGRNSEYGDSLIEENNAWKRWVSRSLLRYYESVHDFRDAGVEIFMPIGRTFQCP